MFLSSINNFYQWITFEFSSRSPFHDIYMFALFYANYNCENPIFDNPAWNLCNLSIIPLKLIYEQTKHDYISNTKTLNSNVPL